MRKFYIENEIGSRLPLNGEQGIFLSNPAGLGLTLPANYADIHKGFFRDISGESEPQVTITGDLVFIGENAYADYRTFVDWCSASESLHLIYKPYGTTEFYRDIQINYLTKTELTDTRWLTVPTALACMSPWYRAAPTSMAMSTESGYVLKYPFSYTKDLIYSSSSAGSMAADIPAGGHIPAAFEITYRGAITNPKISLVGTATNKTYGICALKATLSDNESFTVSSLYGKCRVEITDADGITTVALNSVDLAYEPFPRIPVNEDCTLLMAADSDIVGRATVRVYYYYRSV